MKRIAALLLLACLAAEAHAFDSFVVSEIRIDGLQRIAPGTVFTYLPVEKGDRMTADAAEKAIPRAVQDRLLQRRAARVRTTSSS